MLCTASRTVTLTPSSISLRVTMDFFQHRYYKLNKTVMTVSASWPYESTRFRCGQTVVLVCVLATQVIPQILAFVEYRGERGIVVECIIAFLFEAVCVTKLFGCLWNTQKLMKLLNRIRTDWQVWARDPEVNILHEYADQGRKMSLAFTAETYTIAFVYLMQPTIPKIIDVLLKNGTAHGEFPFPVKYYHLDSQKYYFYMVMHIYVCVSIGSIVFLASTIMMIIYVQHVCGIFAALGCKLQRIGNNHTSVKSGGTSYALEKKDMVDLASAIDRHNDAIDCANLIEATYSWTSFCILTFGATMLTLVGIQILLGKSNPEATVRFIGIALTIILHLYVECHISQILIDHSNSIHLYIYDSQWYNLTPKAQDLLRLMIMRCNIPCKLSAGHFLIFSMSTFGQILRTFMSYFTVVRSMQF